MKLGEVGDGMLTVDSIAALRRQGWPERGSVEEYGPIVGWAIEGTYGVLRRTDGCSGCQEARGLLRDDLVVLDVVAGQYT